MMYAENIPLFTNMASLEYALEYYDFHNDYKCIGYSLANENVCLRFTHCVTSKIVNLNFYSVKVCAFNIDIASGIGFETLDNLYRGRVVLANQLVETSADNGGYFYLEFYGGASFEFWAKSVNVATH